MKLVGLFNVVFYGSVIGATLLAMHGSLRLTFVGILCVALTIAMYASPLAAMVTILNPSLPRLRFDISRILEVENTCLINRETW